MSIPRKTHRMNWYWVTKKFTKGLCFRSTFEWTNCYEHQVGLQLLSAMV